MAKYRKLTLDELESLEPEFIEFLVVNGIPADEWKQLKKDESKADQLIHAFSDVVFEKILRQIQFLTHYSKNSIKTFKCESDRISLMGVDTDDPEIDLTNDTDIKRFKKSPPKDLKIYKSSKSYHPNRESELYKMLQQGCQKTDGSMYELLFNATE